MRRRQRSEPDPLDIIWPSYVKIHPDHVEVGNQVVRCFTIIGYPREVGAGWFEPILGFPHPLSIAIQSAPVDNGAVVRSLSRRMIWHRGAAEADRAQGRVSRAEQLVALEDAERVRFDLAKGETRMIEVGLTIALWAPNLGALDESTRLFESLAQGMMLVVRQLTYQQEVGLRQVVPLGGPPDKVREMDSRAWATLFPFSSRDVIHPQGQVLGVNPSSRSFIVADRFQLASPHSITIGWSGAGKSFAAKLEALRSRYRGLAVTVIDPEGEYRWLQQVGAHLYRLGGRDNTAAFPFDPFSISGHAMDEIAREIDFLLRLLRRLSSELMDEFGSIVHDAIWRAVGRRRGRFSPDSTDESVRFDDLLMEVQSDSRRARDRLSVVWQRWQMAVGSQGSSMEPGPFEVFDFSRLGDAMKGPGYLALTEWLVRRMGQESGRRLIIFDEAWHLLNDGQSATYLEELFRRARKWDTALSLLSQDIGDFTRSRAAEVCLRNAPMVLLLRQHPESVAEVTELLRLHEGETQVIAQASPGEGLLLLGDDHIPVQIIASPRERALLTAEAGVRGEVS